MSNIEHLQKFVSWPWGAKHIGNLFWPLCLAFSLAACTDSRPRTDQWKGLLSTGGDPYEIWLLPNRPSPRLFRHVWANNGMGSYHRCLVWDAEHPAALDVEIKYESGPNTIRDLHPGYPCFTNGIAIPTAVRLTSSVEQIVRIEWRAFSTNPNSRLPPPTPGYTPGICGPTDDRCPLKRAVPRVADIKSADQAAEMRMFALYVLIGVGAIAYLLRQPKNRKRLFQLLNYVSAGVVAAYTSLVPSKRAQRLSAEITQASRKRDTISAEGLRNYYDGENSTLNRRRDILELEKLLAQALAEIEVLKQREQSMAADAAEHERLIKDVDEAIARVRKLQALLDDQDRGA